MAKRTGAGVQKKELYFLYENVYAGNRSSILGGTGCGLISSDQAAGLCRYVCDKYLQWDYNDVMAHFDLSVMKQMKLGSLLRETAFPKGMPSEEKVSILKQKMYQTESMEGYDRKITLRMYKKRLDGKLPAMRRGIFEGSEGRDRLCMCLLYALARIEGCKNERECRMIMESERAYEFLRQAKLYDQMKKKYASPKLFYRDALQYAGRLWKQSAQKH